MSLRSAVKSSANIGGSLNGPHGVSEEHGIPIHLHLIQNIKNIYLTTTIFILYLEKKY
jgi:hypothetical protein